MIKNLDTKQLGHYGECYVLLKLAERGIYATKVPYDFEYDLLTSNHLRLEVKIARARKSTRGSSLLWRFTNKGVRQGRQVHRDRECDFFILTGIQENNLSTFIVPKETIGTLYNICIPCAGKSKWHKWKNKWDLITAFSTGVSTHEQ